jgi:ribose transport system substrate-binding protein
MLRYAGLSCLFMLSLVGCGSSDQASNSKPSQDASIFAPTDLLQMRDTLKGAIMGKGNPADLKFGVITNNQADFWIPNGIGVSKAADEIGCQGYFEGPASGTTDEQVAMFNSLVSEGYSGIAISPIDAVAIEPTITTAVANATNVLTFDSDGVPGSKRALYVGSLNGVAGTAAGQKMVELLGSAGGQVAAFVGYEKASNAIERVTAIQAAFAGTPVQLVKVYYDNVDFTVARSNVDLALAEYPDLKGMMGLYSYNPQYIGEGLKAAGLEKKITTVMFDLEPATKTLLEEGSINATVVQRPYFMGYLDVYILYAMKVNGVAATTSLLAPWLGGDNQDVIDTGINVITPTDLDKFEAYLASLGLPSN